MTVNELNSLTARNRLVLVDFYASWCGPCNAMHPILDTVEKQFGNSVDVLRVDVDQYESVGLVKHFRIMSVPTLMFSAEAVCCGGVVVLCRLKRWWM